VGSAWHNLSEDNKNELQKELRHNDLLKTFVNILGFTLSKIELEVFKLYLRHGLGQKKADIYFEEFKQEYLKTLSFYKKMTNAKDFLWFRPWLQESINLRSSMIHPLNMIQLIAIKKNDPYLLRETVTGISCGMMTTG